MSGGDGPKKVATVFHQCLQGDWRKADVIPKEVIRISSAGSSPKVERLRAIPNFI